MREQNNKLIHSLLQYDSRVFLRNGDGESISYRKIAELSRESAFSLAQRLLVFCMAENDLGGLVGYLGLLVAEAVPLMLGVSISPSQLNELIAAYRPSYIWLPISRKDELPGSTCIFNYHGYCFLELGYQPYEIHDSLALLLSTSGSTGSPKFVRLSHENLFSNAQSIAQYLELTSDEIPITTLPPNYTYGLSIIHSHMLVGATIAVTNKTFFDRSFWDFLREIKATSFGGVPYHYEILKKLRFTSMDLPSLRTLTQAGGRMEPELTKEYATHCAIRGMRYFTMYGQTEATARMSYLPAEKAITKAGSIGIPIPGGCIWLEDDQGRLQKDNNKVGELVFKGPNVSMGYASGYEDLFKGDESKGVLRTGDLARRDADGYYYIVGRLKRFLKLFGHRVNLLDIEKHLLDAGHLVACAGRDDRLEVYLPNGDQELAKAIKNMLLKYLKVKHDAVRVIVVGDLPRNDSGKIQYSELTPKVGFIQV